MNKETSTYLDLVRFSAAMTVLFFHLSGKGRSGGIGWQFAPFGQPAVDVFFVLSGFVIAYVVAAKERDIRTYVISRAARLYSVVIPALILTFALGVIGNHYNPRFSWGDFTLSSYLRAATFTNELWFRHVEPGTSTVFWSLSYEAFYYALFAAALFAGRHRAISCACIALIAGPKILLLLPLWLMGVGAYWTTQHKTISAGGGLGIWLSSIATVTGLTCWAVWHFGFTTILVGPQLRRGDEWWLYGADYLIGAMVAANFIGFYFSAKYWAALVRAVRRPVAWLAGATFTLYLTHWPISQFLIATSPWKVGTLEERCLVYGGTLLAVFLLAELTERKKYMWRKSLSAVWPRPLRHPQQIASE